MSQRLELCKTWLLPLELRKTSLVPPWSWTGPLTLWLELKCKSLWRVRPCSLQRELNNSSSQERHNSSLPVLLCRSHSEQPKQLP